MEKLKLVFVDTYKNGPNHLDHVFKEDAVELCELFTLDGQDGVDLTTIGDYCGYDYAVVTAAERDFEKIKGVLARLGLTSDKLIFLSLDEIICDDFEKVRGYFVDEYLEMMKYQKVKMKYESNIMGEYALVTVEDLSYVNIASDDTIMVEMYNKKENFSKDSIDAFYELGNKYFPFSDKQDLFCDIGANIGTTSIYFKKKLDNSVKILAFEPARMNHKLYRVNAILNDINDDELTLAKYAVSDERAICKFEYSATNPGGSGLISGWETDVSVEEVETIPFDEYVEENGIDINRIKWVWIDVEGFEPAFFKGARKTLSSINVPIIFEYSPKLYRETGRWDEFKELLFEQYTSFLIMQEDGEKIHPIKDITLYENFEYQLDIMLFKA